MGIHDLLASLGVQAPPGVTAAALNAFEADTRLRLPESVRALYAACDGAVLPQGRLRILPLAGVREHVRGFRDFGIPERWGYLPFTDDNDSDPFCVCCAPPLTGYVVQVLHDDGAAIKFRSLGRFLAALHGFVAEGGRDLYGLPSDFDNEARTAGDIETGRALLRLAPDLEGVEQGDACRFGMWLLPGDLIGEITPLLQVGDEYVREDATRRLAAIHSPEAAQALRDAQQDMARFVERCAEALRRAGVQATIKNGTDLTAGPQGRGVNARMYYAMRAEPDVFDRLVNQFRAP